MVGRFQYSPLPGFTLSVRLRKIGTPTHTPTRALCSANPSQKQEVGYTGIYSRAILCHFLRGRRSASKQGRQRRNIDNDINDFSFTPTYQMWAIRWLCRYIAVSRKRICEYGDDWRTCCSNSTNKSIPEMLKVI